MGESYPSAEVYSTAPGNWASIKGGGRRSKDKREVKGEMEREVVVGLSDGGVLTVTVCMVMESNVSGFI